MPSLIPEPHAGYARRVCQLVTDGAPSLRDRISTQAGLSVAYATRLIEDPSIACIAGERGSGKTTVLATVAAQLSGDGHVVIPPVRPEYFSAPGSLLPTAVAHLQTTVRTDWLGDDAVDPDTALRIATAIDRTLRQANLISYGAPSSSFLRADEQAADRSLAESADSDFLDHWQQLTEQVRQMAAARNGSAPEPLIIIPVDDPDLAPGTLRQILLDLRLMTSVTGVVGIACLDLEEARFVLADAYARSYVSAPNRLLSARVVEAQIAKAFPDDRTVAILGLNDEKKLSFTALDLSLPPLEGLCQAHSFGEAYANDTIASLFRMPGTEAPSLYANALPANPRDLRGLAYRLSDIPTDKETSVGKAAMELCRTAILTGLKQSGATDPAVWPSGLPFEELPPVDGLPSCTLSFDNIEVNGVPAKRKQIPTTTDDGSTSITLSHDSAIETLLVTRGTNVETRERLHPSLSYALLLIREFSEYYGVIHCNLTGPPPISGGERPSPYFSVVFERTATDNRFLNAPAWEAYYDYFLLDAAMSALIPVASSPHEHADYRLVVEAFVIDFCRSIVSIQATRRHAKDPSRVSRGVRERDEMRAQRLLAREIKRLFADIEQCLVLEEERRRSDDVRVSDFRRWVEIEMPNVCHERLLRPKFIDELLSHRANLLGRRHRLAVANRVLCMGLERRIKSALDESWVKQLIALVQRIDEELGAVLMASHTAALEAIERGRSRLLGETVVSTSARSDSQSEAPRPSSDFDIALAVLDALEAETRALAQRSSA